MTGQRKPPFEWFHCLRCDRDVPASEVTHQTWMQARIGTFHSCGDYAHPAWEPHANAQTQVHVEPGPCDCARCLTGGS